MSPFSVLLTLLVYLALLFSVAYVSGRGADNAGFFIGNWGRAGRERALMVYAVLYA